MSGRVALVTGGNRGIGFEVCKNLCKKFKESNGTVILSARDEDSGLEACNRLSEDGFNSCFMHLDVTSKTSIENVVKKIKKDFNGLDILINNAGIMYSASKSKDIPYAEQVESTLNTNFFGLLNVFDSIFPLLRPQARVVNVTSRLGSFDNFGQEIKQKLRDRSLDRDGLLSLVCSYIKTVKNNTHKESGWPDQDSDSWMPAGQQRWSTQIFLNRSLPSKHLITFKDQPICLKRSAHCRGTGWMDKTITKNGIRQASVVSLYTEIHEDDNDMTPFILETKYDPRT